MKKNYLALCIAMICTLGAVHAQFVDDFEAYALGTYHGTHWSSWSGTAGSEDIIVSNTVAFDGTKAGLIAGSTVQDALLNLGNKTSGLYEVSFQVYIPAGKSGYMNFQGTLSPSGGASTGGVFNSPNLIFNNVQSLGGAPGLGGAYPNVGDASATYTWSYPEGTWFPISIEFDIDNGLWTMTINGTALPAQPFDDENVLGGLDFYSFDANNEMYIDAIVYTDLLSVGEEVFNTFKVYPNPVRDYLFLSSATSVDLVEVYDVLGHRVLSVVPEAMAPKIDFSSLASGSYFVKASKGTHSKTFKIIK